MDALWWKVRCRKAWCWGAAVNWSRGLLRLWIAFTVFWVGAVGWFLYLDNPGYFSTPVQSTVSPTKGDWIVENPKQSSEVSFDDLIPGTPANAHRVFWKESVPAAVMWAVAVPAFFYAVGWTLLWIGRGFRSPPRV